MAFKRLSVVVLSLALGMVAGTAQAQKSWSLVGGGGQLHIGDGLALPIQQAATVLVTGNKFPPLGVPVKAGPAPAITGSTGNPLIDCSVVGACTAIGTKQGYQNKLVVPTGVLSRAAAQTTVGVFFSNTTLFAVGTNLNYTWPAAAATFATTKAVGGAGTGPVQITFGGLNATMTYSNPLKKRFGGAAQFNLQPGAVDGGHYTSSDVTIYAKINAATAPCTHNAGFWGPVGTSGCVSGLVIAKPTGLAGQGGTSLGTVMTPGGIASAPNIVLHKLGAAPTHVSGTLLPGFAAPVLPASPPYAFRAITFGGVSNMATSQQGPWTTGRLVIKNLNASPNETFTLSGRDSRTSRGAGTIQMVSGSLSNRKTTGPNANRGWVELTMVGPFGVPALSPAALGVMAGLMLLAAGYAMRRRIFA